MAFADQGLVLGAGTVLAPSRGERTVRSVRVEASDRRVLALLSAAYGQRMRPEVIGHLTRAAELWSDGRDGLAAMHLACTGLGRLPDPEAAGRRLFVAECLMEAGAAPDLVLKALGFADPNSADRLLRYDRNEPRVPAGSGDPSGQWTEGGGTAGEGARPREAHAAQTRSTVTASRARTAPSHTSSRMAPKPAGGTTQRQGPPTRPSKTLFQAPQGRRPPSPPLRTAPPRIAGRVGIDSEREAAEARQTAGNRAVRAVGNAIFDWTVAELVRRPLQRLPAAVAFFGVLLAPTALFLGREDTRIPGHPNLRIHRNPGSFDWFLSDVDAGTSISLTRERDGSLRDPSGRLVAHLLPNENIVFDLDAIAPRPAGSNEDDRPRLCPSPSPDKRGQGRDSISRAYENQMKALINPGNPTPDGMAIALSAPTRGGDPVLIDDCQHSTGDYYEYKGPTYEEFRQRSIQGNFSDSPDAKLLKQALDQIGAVGSHRLHWLVADQEFADHLRELFRRKNMGRERIEIEVAPFAGTTR